jgi:ligand-binding sensor domain-containing protein
MIKLDFDLNQISIAINDNSMEDIHFDLSNNRLYIASWAHRIYIYHTNDEITFNKIHTVNADYGLGGITIYNDKIYTGTEFGVILVYNKTSNTLIQTMNNMCSSHIYSISNDFFGNMIYSCKSPPMVKIIGTNATLLLSNTFSEVWTTFIDSKNILWIGGVNGIVVYN